MSCSFMSQTNISSGCMKEEIILSCDDPFYRDKTYIHHVFNTECDFNSVKVL